MNEIKIKTVMITGASTGIGYATTVRLLQAGFYVFPTVRTLEAAQNLTHKLDAITSNHGRHTILLLDVCNPDLIQSAKENLENHLNGKPLDALVNNAGVALGGPLLEIDMNLLRTQMEVNLVGLLNVIQVFAPLLGVKHRNTKGGRIINVSSISGVRAMPFVGPYTASKFALEGLSDSLRMELIPYGIDVILIQPGPIKTAIWDKAPSPDEHPSIDGPYGDALRRFHQQFIETGKQGMHPDKIAQLIYHALTVKNPKARYVRTPGYFTRYLLPKWLSTRTFDRFITRMLGLDPTTFHDR